MDNTVQNTKQNQIEDLGQVIFKIIKDNFEKKANQPKRFTTLSEI